MKKVKGEKLVPELRFPEFKGEWENVKFSNYFEFLRSSSFSRRQLNYRGGEVLNIHYGDIHSKFNSLFFASHERVPFINKDVDLEKFKKTDYLKAGDLVIADASEDYKDICKSIEIIDLNGKEALAGLHTIPVRTEEKHALGFLGNLMKTYHVRHQIMRAANGISVFGISKTNIGKLKLILPSPEEQQKIASFLSLIDKKIELLKKKKELLELYKKGVMQKIFNREIRFKDKNGNDYPEWEQKRLGEICDITTGRLDANAMVEGGKYRFYTCAAEYFYTDSYAFDTDALIISGNGANVGYIHRYKGKFNAYQRTYVLDKFSEDIEYIKIFLNKYLELRIDKEKRTSNTPYIVLGTLNNMNIKIPSKQEQLEIKKVIGNLGKYTEGFEVYLGYLRVFKKGLLQNMFI